ncbi:MND1-interacting protein 1-like [Impatiens glandulifera]|uniref:MND1-interacting protein 1-like n=1 Tax=Impatiens glandulifera TaxID=253017 RepID=UPI001FB0D48B|nr:MND1-interacting protein 1-like [Impatiens glandulifera]
MGCTVGEKHIRANRKTRSLIRTDVGNNNNNADNKPSVPSASLESGIGSVNYQFAADGSVEDTDVSTNFDLVDETGWEYFSEGQLEEILLTNLKFLYKEALSKLIGLGYDESVALKAILMRGHSYGQSDVLTNILHNSLSYLNGSMSMVSDDSSPYFTDLRQLEEYSLAALVCFLQRVKPNLSKGDAMWCLLESNLHLARASAMDFPGIPTSANNGPSNPAPSNNTVGMSTGPAEFSPDLCRFHGGWGFGNGGTSEFPSNGYSSSYASEGGTMQKEIECPKRYNLTPSMKSLLKRNVALFAAGFRANSRQSQVSPSTLAAMDNPGTLNVHKKEEEHQVSSSQDVVTAVLSKFRELNLDEGTDSVSEDQKDEVILNLISQIKDLEKQVKERKEWAQQKAMQAARKLSNDLTELKMLRMEREDILRMKKGKLPLDDTTMKRFSDMETALRKASGQVDRANAAVRRLEVENAEIRAEIEASKLSASESVNASMEVAKREKKSLKKLSAWEKQKTKLQEEIAAEKQKISESQKQLVQIEAAQKEAEERLRKEVKAKEYAEVKVEEERRLKEETEASNKRKLESLRLKIEIDFHRHKDDIQRLEQELCNLKASSNNNNNAAAATYLQNNNSNIKSNKGEGGKKMTQEESIAKMLNDLDEEVVAIDRKCLICTKEEVSVVFLPCAHQVLCSRCNDDHGKKKGKTTCPCCRAPIEQRIRVYGTSS